MSEQMRNALIVAAIVFALVVLVPIASFLLKAVVVAAIAGAAVYALQVLLGPPRR